MPPKFDPACRGLGRGLRRPPPDMSLLATSKLLATSTPLEKTYVSAEKPEPEPETEDWNSDESQVSLCTILLQFSAPK